MDFTGLIFFFIIIIPSAILHEYMHGWVADQMGDPTARYAGRLTLDPRAHIDPMGTVFLPLVLFLLSGGGFMFAYAKPVPYNPFNLKAGKWGPVWVAIAGPAANFFLALVFGLVIQFAPLSITLTILLSIIVYANILLGVFNMVPIPPLDGSKVLFALFPPSMFKFRAALEQYGFVFLLIFVFFFFQLISPIILWLFRLFTGGAGVI